MDPILDNMENIFYREHEYEFYLLQNISLMFFEKTTFILGILFQNLLKSQFIQRKFKHLLWKK